MLGLIHKTCLRSKRTFLLPKAVLQLHFMPRISNADSELCVDTAIAMNLKGTLVNVAPNVPFGIAFIGRRWSEETLISLAYAFEQRTMIRNKRKPYIIPTFELGDCQTNGYQADIRLSSTDSNQTSMPSEAIEAIVKRSISNLFSTRSWTWSLLARAGSSL